MVEIQISNLEVAGSNPVIRSIVEGGIQVRREAVDFV